MYNGDERTGTLLRTLSGDYTSTTVPGALSSTGDLTLVFMDNCATCAHRAVGASAPLLPEIPGHDTDGFHRGYAFLYWCEPRDEILAGCTDEAAINYESFAHIDDGSCQPSMRGLPLPAAPAGCRFSSAPAASSTPLNLQGTAQMQTLQAHMPGSLVDCSWIVQCPAEDVVGYKFIGMSFDEAELRMCDANEAMSDDGDEQEEFLLAIDFGSSAGSAPAPWATLDRAVQDEAVQLGEVGVTLTVVNGLFEDVVEGGSLGSANENIDGVPVPQEARSDYWLTSSQVRLRIDGLSEGTHKVTAFRSGAVDGTSFATICANEECGTGTFTGGSGSLIVVVGPRQPLWIDVPASVAISGMLVRGLPAPEFVVSVNGDEVDGPAIALEYGARPWSDNDYKFNSIPGPLDDAFLFPLSRSVSSGATVTIFNFGTESIELYVAVDSEHGTDRSGGYETSLPEAGWLDPETILADWDVAVRDGSNMNLVAAYNLLQGGDAPMRLFRHEVAAGAVITLPVTTTEVTEMVIIAVVEGFVHGSLTSHASEALDRSTIEAWQGERVPSRPFLKATSASTMLVSLHKGAGSIQHEMSNTFELQYRCLTPAQQRAEGCLDPAAPNYDPTAEIDDGSCHTACHDGPLTFEGNGTVNFTGYSAGDDCQWLLQCSSGFVPALHFHSFYTRAHRYIEPTVVGISPSTEPREQESDDLFLHAGWNLGAQRAEERTVIGRFSGNALPPDVSAPRTQSALLLRFTARGAQDKADSLAPPYGFAFDHRCVQPEAVGCTEVEVEANFNADALFNDGSCDYATAIIAEREALLHTVVPGVDRTWRRSGQSELYGRWSADSNPCEPTLAEFNRTHEGAQYYDESTRDGQHHIAEDLEATGHGYSTHGGWPSVGCDWSGIGARRHIVNVEIHGGNVGSGQTCSDGADASQCVRTLGADLGGFEHLAALRVVDSIRGTVSASLATLPRLAELSLSNSDRIRTHTLSGTIPEGMWRMVSLRSLAGSNSRISGTISDFIGEMVSLESLDFARTSLSGTMPDGLAQLLLLQLLLLDQTLISGTMPSLGATFLEQFLVAETCLSGTIPEAVGRMKRLSSWSVPSISLSGTLPVMQEMAELSVLDVHGNSLSGSLPSINLTKLTRIDIRDNKFTGWPKSLIGCKSLALIDASNNNFPRLPTGMVFPPHLTHLLLAGSPIISNAAELGKMLEEAGQHLFNLDVHYVTSAPYLVGARLSDDVIGSDLCRKVLQDDSPLGAHPDCWGARFVQRPVECYLGNDAPPCTFVFQIFDADDFPMRYGGYILEPVIGMLGEETGSRSSMVDLQDGTYSATIPSDWVSTPGDHTVVFYRNIPSFEERFGVTMEDHSGRSYETQFHVRYHPVQCQYNTEADTSNVNCTCKEHFVPLGRGQPLRCGRDCDEADGLAMSSADTTQCECLPGHHSEDGVCSRCPLHAICLGGPLAVATMTVCPAGKQPDQTGQRCEACPSGLVSPGHALCTSCKHGQEADNGVRCSCAPVHYNSTQFAHSTIQCIARDIEMDGSVPAEEECTSCAGVLACMSCDEDGVRTQAGWAAAGRLITGRITRGRFGERVLAQPAEAVLQNSSSPEVHGPAPYNVFRCPLTGACPAGEGCNDGYTGVLCGICAPSYGRVRQECKLCDAIGTSWSSWFLAVLIIGTAAWAWRQRRTGGGGGSELQQQLTSNLAYDGRLEDAPANDGLPKPRQLTTLIRILSQPVRITITSFQVISLIGPVLQLEFPENTQWIMEAMRPVADPIGTLLQFKCQGDLSFHTTWMIQTLGAPAALVCGILMWYQRELKTAVRELAIERCRAMLFATTFFIYREFASASRIDRSVSTCDDSLPSVLKELLRSQPGSAIVLFNPSTAAGAWAEGMQRQSDL